MCLQGRLDDADEPRDRPGDAKPVDYCLDFEISEAQAWAAARASTAGPSLRRDVLRLAGRDMLQALWLPVYLYSARLEGRYQAEIGETYTESQWQGSTRRTKFKIERHTLKGVYKSALSDVVVTATAGLHNDLLESIEPFDFSRLRRFEPPLEEDKLAALPAIRQDAGLRFAREEAEDRFNAQLKRSLPGDLKELMELRLEFKQEALELCWVPIWRLAVPVKSPSRDKQKSLMQILINGQSGKTVKDLLISGSKLTLALMVPALLILAAALSYLLITVLGS